MMRVWKFFEVISAFNRRTVTSRRAVSSRSAPRLKRRLSIISSSAVNDSL